MSDHQIIEISCIYTTNRRCWFSHKNTSLTGKYHHKSWFLMITWKLLLVTAVILSIEMLGFSEIKTWFRPKEFCGKYKSVGSVSLVGLQGSGSVPGHPGWPIYVQMAIPNLISCQTSIENRIPDWFSDFPVIAISLQYWSCLPYLSLHFSVCSVLNRTNFRALAWAALAGPGPRQN